MLRIAVFRGGSDRVERISQKSQLSGIFPSGQQNTNEQFIKRKFHLLGDILRVEKGRRQIKAAIDGSLGGVRLHDTAEKSIKSIRVQSIFHVFLDGQFFIDIMQWAFFGRH